MKKLLQIIRPEILSILSEKQKRAIQVIDDEDFSQVKKKLVEEFKKQNFFPDDEYLENGFLALKQYYAVAVIDQLNMHAVSDKVDPFWHMHILFTEQYYNLSMNTLGFYMHHDPLDHDNTDKVDFIVKLYDYTNEVYDKMFSWKDENFYPEQMPRASMVCYHYTGDSSDRCEHIFPIKAEFEDFYKKYSKKVAA